MQHMSKLMFVIVIDVIGVVLHTNYSPNIFKWNIIKQYFIKEQYAAHVLQFLNCCSAWPALYSKNLAQ